MISIGILFQLQLLVLLVLVFMFVVAPLVAVVGIMRQSRQVPRCALGPDRLPAKWVKVEGITTEVSNLSISGRFKLLFGLGKVILERPTWLDEEQLEELLSDRSLDLENATESKALLERAGLTMRSFLRTHVPSIVIASCIAVLAFLPSIVEIKEDQKDLVFVTQLLSLVALAISLVGILTLSLWSIAEANQRMLVRNYKNQKVKWKQTRLFFFFSVFEAFVHRDSVCYWSLSKVKEPNKTLSQGNFILKTRYDSLGRTSSRDLGESDGSTQGESAPSLEEILSSRSYN